MYIYSKSNTFTVKGKEDCTEYMINLIAPDFQLSSPIPQNISTGCDPEEVHDVVEGVPNC